MVLRPAHQATERELREFVASHLSALKVPRRIVFAEELPKNAVGKPQRIGAAGHFGLTEEGFRTASRTDFAEPRTEIEIMLAQRWQRILKLERLGIDDNFFDLGGDSLGAIAMGLYLERAFGVKVSVVDLLEAPTVAQLAALIEHGHSTGARRRLFSVKPGGSLPPFFCIGAGPLFRALADKLLEDQPFLSPLLYDFADFPNPCRLEDIAATHLGTIRAEQPKGPYYLGGWCIHGIIAFEAARQLRAVGEQVALVILFNWHLPAPPDASELAASKWRLKLLIRKLRYHTDMLLEAPPRELRSYLSERADGMLFKLRRKSVQTRYSARTRLGLVADVAPHEAIMVDQLAALTYRPGPYDGDVLLIRPVDRPGRSDTDLAVGWDEVVTGRLEIFEAAGDHRSMFHAPNVDKLAARVLGCLRRTGIVSGDQRDEVRRPMVEKAEI